MYHPLHDIMYVSSLAQLQVRRMDQSHDHHEDSEDDDSVAPELDASYDKEGRRKRHKNKVYCQIWHKAGFMLLWMALGLDTIISILGHPILGQSASAICVLMYILYNVSFRRVVCSFWFTVIDFFFRQGHLQLLILPYLTLVILLVFVI